ncbi:hypothetical protein ACFTQ8_19310, partial [Heyndrickxia sporothermodurans]
HCPIPLAGKNIYFSIVKNMVTKSFTQNNLHNQIVVEKANDSVQKSAKRYIQALQGELFNT